MSTDANKGGSHAFVVPHLPFLGPFRFDRSESSSSSCHVGGYSCLFMPLEFIERQGRKKMRTDGRKAALSVAVVVMATQHKRGCGKRSSIGGVDFWHLSLFDLFD
jgi:hypothetical protein